MKIAFFYFLLIFSGTALSILLIPEYPQPAGELFIPSFVLVFIFFWILALEYMQAGMKRLVLTQNILLFGVIYWVLSDVIQGLYPVYVEKEIIELSFLAIGLFAGCVIFASAFTVKLLPKSIYRLAYIDPRPRQLFNMIIICFIFGIFYYSYKSDFSLSLMVDGLKKGRFAAPWSRGKFGGWDSFIEHLSYFSYLLPVLTVWLAHIRKSWLRIDVLAAVALSVVMLLFVAQGGARSNVGAMVGSGLLFWVLIHLHKITLWRIIIIITIATSLLLFFNFMLEIRRIGIEKIDYAGQKQEQVTGIRVDDNYLRIVQTIKYFPEKREHAGFQWIIYALVRPVPRVLWPGKPEYSGVGIDAVVDSQGASLSSSIIGESYAAFGWLGIIGTGLFFGFMGSSVNRILNLRGEKSAALVFSLCVMALFLGLRSLINLVLMTYPILALWLLSIVFKHGLYKRKILMENHSVRP